jgi:hypothetical protein
METFGKHKRDILRSNIQSAAEDQKAATQEFQDALTRLKQLYGFKGGDIETMYNSLNRDYERCSKRAETVHERVRAVETVANDLFREWENEIKQISSESLRANSRDRLNETKSRYKTMHDTMKKAESSMEPVLVQFRDNVLYLKHNLNAQAIGTIQKEALNIESEIQKLIADMNASINQADTFIRGLK